MNSIEKIEWFFFGFIPLGVGYTGGRQGAKKYGIMGSMKPENFQDWQKKIKFRRRRRRNLEKIRFFEPKNGLFGQKRQMLANFGCVGFHQAKFFENLENFRKNFGLMKLQRPAKWPKKAIKMKISGVDEAPKFFRPPPIPLVQLMIKTSNSH